MKNAEINKVNNITFFEGDLFEPLGKCTFDVIVSNPPYIRTDDIGGLQKEIRDWEPVTALDGGEDGLNYYRAIIGDLRRFLSDKGRCYLEIGYDQRDGIDAIVKENGLNAWYIRDLAGIDRIAVLSF
ncbi:MAG: peptide chain release factor N(5)-glutamine methyltransferase [Nitrospirota bacterium]|nr:MAG: peptide chain release factor N(5)-glutamine methyltransferase [Nitrospirota bacterium]